MLSSAWHLVNAGKHTSPVCLTHVNAYVGLSTALQEIRKANSTVWNTRSPPLRPEEDTPKSMSLQTLQRDTVLQMKIQRLLLSPGK